MITEQDLLDLLVCGKAPLGENKNLFYSLKTRILEEFGMFYGYCEQYWYDYEYESFEFDSSGRKIYNTYAKHRHILKIYWLSTQDGKFVSREFHIPTNEFSYWINWSNVFKQSLNFENLLSQCKYSFEGKKEKYFILSGVAWISLKNLVRKYGHLLKTVTKYP